MSLFSYFFKFYSFAEPRHILIGHCFVVYGFVSPCVVGVGYFFDVFCGEFSVSAVYHGAEFSGVYEEGFSSAVSEFVVLFVSCYEP